MSDVGKSDVGRADESTFDKVDEFAKGAETEQPDAAEPAEPGIPMSSDQSGPAVLGDSPPAPSERDEQEESPTGRYAVSVDHRDRVCYALAYNKVPTVRGITVRNDGGPTTGQLTITTQITWTAASTQPMAPTEVVIDAPARGQSVVVGGESFRLSDAALVDLTEEAPAVVTVVVTDAEGNTDSVSSDIAIMARNQWLNSDDIHSITAAFVQPNHPAVNDVLRDAGGILQKRTGSSSLGGYQSGPERVVEIAAGIFEALQNRIDRYINPPASFATEGQKLRPLDEVLETRQGTCLDLACAYASCLEQAGIDAFIVLVHGHAFTGFLTAQKGQSHEAVIKDFTTLVTMREAGLLIGVETTILPESSSKVGFVQAVKETECHFAEREAECGHCAEIAAAGYPVGQMTHLEAGVNLTKCHQEGVLPLPARVVRDGIVTIVIDQGSAMPPVIERRDEKTKKLLPNTVPARVQQWKNSLLDLSFRNSLLNFKPERSGLPLLAGKKVLHVLEDWINTGQPVGIVAMDDISEIHQQQGFRSAQNFTDELLHELWTKGRTLFGGLDRAQFKTRLSNLRSKAKTDEQDTGVNNLYLTLGTLRWNDPKSSMSEVRSPIFLVPIRIVVKRGSDVSLMVIDENSSTTINYCLIEALRARRGMKLSWFNEDMSDDAGLDVERGLQELRDELLDQHLTSQGFEVIDEASIGLLKFSKIRLWRDLDDHWEDFAQSPIVKHLIDGAGQAFVDPQDPERIGVAAISDADLMNPQPADGAQSRVIGRALQQQSFVLEGPPGTGKSQTIANLLANALANGKRVLFVAEKQAALEVVKERLTEVGLNPFCLDLHDKGSSPADIKNQLREALDFKPSANMALWQDNDEQFDARARVLAAYRDKVHGQNQGGTSYYEAYSRLLEIGPGITAPVKRSLFQVDAERIAKWRRVLGDLESYTEAALPRPGHPWSLAGDVVFDDVDLAGLGAAVSAVRTALETIDAADDPWLRLIGQAASIDDVDGVVATMEASAVGACPPPDQLRAVLMPGWSDAVAGALDRMANTLESSQDLIAALGEDFLLRDDSAVKAAVIQAASSFVMGRKGRVKSALGALASTSLFSDAESDNATALIGRMVTAAQSIAAELSTLQSTPGLTLPQGWQPTSSEAIQNLRERAGSIARFARFVATDSDLTRSAVSLATGFNLPNPELIATAAAFTSSVPAVQEQLRSTDQSTQRWCNDRTFVAAVRESLPDWSSDLAAGTWVRVHRWLDLAGQVAVLDDESVDEFKSELLSGRIDGADALKAFDRSIMEVTLEVVGEEMALDTFDHASHGRRVGDFITLLQERQELLRSVIPHNLYAARSFDGTSGAGEVGQLRLELNSKRRGARSVRHLISGYPKLISSLTPCFLMSPDSIAKFIEPGKLKFDIVVFDEASQITVSSAIGALGRATSAVIVGDSRQMPPTLVMGPKADDDFDDDVFGSDDPVFVDAESILDECIDSGLDQEWLAWHYRSKDELLIKFSNDKYYDGRLSSFPSPWQNVPNCGMEYHRVQGQFDHGGKRHNEVEADAIVAEIRRRVNDPELSKFSIGVVTLNLQQRQLILDKLGSSKDPKLLNIFESDDDSENLFVLNLESVQGRERDVIMFSTAFSPRVGGGKMPLNFGPLTARGGERRLNVAVTRARRQYVIFSSFDAEELSRATSLGMVHLYEYLKLARAASAGERPVTTVASPPGDDMHREVVAEKLRARGLIVETAIGLSSFKVDLGVTLPGFEDRRLVGILLDGQVWASRPLVLDRDALPVTVLQNMMGWTSIARVWLPSWRQDVDEIVEDIYDAAVRAAEAPVSTPEADRKIEQPEGSASDLGMMTQPRAAAEDPNLHDAVEQQAAPSAPPAPMEPAGQPALKGARPFEPFPRPEGLGTIADLEAGSPRARELMQQLSEAYGPIEISSAVKIVAKAFGLGRLNAKRVGELSQLFDPACVIITDFGDYLFPLALLDGNEVRDSFDWYRTSTASERKVTEVAPQEMANVFRAIVLSAFSIERDELANEALKELGYSRKTTDTVGFVQQLIDWSVEAGYLTIEGATLSLDSPTRRR